MANVYISPCDPNLSSFVVDIGENPFVSGNTYYLTFTAETSSGCFTINETTSDPASDTVNTISTQYNDCFECLQDNNWSYLVVSCDDPGLGGPVSATLFNQDPLNKFYNLCASDFEFEGCLCFQVTGITSNVFPYPFVINGPYEDCTCSGIPRSANTETIICEQVCVSGGSEGYTVVQVVPPHPVWTDGYGTPVTQLNAVTLGGMFGLNS
jgi:hypothetical protein